MNVQQCMSIDVRVCAPDTTLREAARAMREIDAGFLPVGENDRLVGMITDRDITTRAVAEGMGPDASVREVMSPEVRYCFEDESLEDVAARMSDQQLRRMPVLNRNKRLVGVISLGDVSRSADAGESGDALRHISEPTGLHSQH